MIRPLRQRHRAVVSVLCVVIPVAVALAVVSRREIPPLPGGVPGLVEKTGGIGEIWSRDDLWTNQAILTRLVRVRGETGRLAVELQSRAPILKPDLLAYWTPGRIGIQDTLPDEAFLLGSLDLSQSAPLPVPSVAVGRDGRLVLYSLADHEIFAVSKPFSAP